jgi:hypothetical protein
MATKNSSSFNVTTSSSVGVDARGKTFSRSSKTTSETISQRKMTRGETAGGLLTGIFQIQMIGITILAISLGSTLTEFTTSDLVETNPNYQLTNDFVPIDDPLNTINYIQYGEDVFDRLNDFIVTFSDMGLVAKNYWDDLVGITELLPVQFTFNFNKLNSLSNAQDYYDDLTLEQQDKWEEVYNTLTFLFDWFYYSPAELTA